jgi:hypothetical protein
MFFYLSIIEFVKVFEKLNLFYLGTVLLNPVDFLRLLTFIESFDLLTTH